MHHRTGKETRTKCRQTERRRSLPRSQQLLSPATPPSLWPGPRGHPCTASRITSTRIASWASITHTGDDVVDQDSEEERGSISTSIRITDINARTATLIVRNLHGTQLLLPRCVCQQFRQDWCGLDKYFCDNLLRFNADDLIYHGPINPTYRGPINPIYLPWSNQMRSPSMITSGMQPTTTRGTLSDARQR